MHLLIDRQAIVFDMTGFSMANMVGLPAWPDGGYC